MKRRLLLFVVVVCGWAWPQPGQAVTVTREVPGTIRPGEPFEVVLRVQAGQPVAVGILEQLPPGCSFNGQGRTLANSEYHLDDPQAGTIAFAAFAGCELRYWVVAHIPDPGPFTGVYVDLLDENPGAVEDRERFQAVEPDPGGQAASALAGRITVGNTPFPPLESLPGDNGDNVLSPDEMASLVCRYLLGKGIGCLDDVRHAARAYSFHGGRPVPADKKGAGPNGPGASMAALAMCAACAGQGWREGPKEARQ